MMAKIRVALDLFQQRDGAWAARQVFPQGARNPDLWVTLEVAVPPALPPAATELALSPPRAEYERKTTDEERADLLMELTSDRTSGSTERIGCNVLADLRACESALSALQRERDEALQLAEGPSSLKDLAAMAFERGTQVAAREVRVRALEEAASKVVRGIDTWNESIQGIIGRQPDYNWGDLESLRALLSGAAKREETP